MEIEKVIVSDEVFSELEKALLETPAAANEKLKELMGRKPAWEKPHAEKPE